MPPPVDNTDKTGQDGVPEAPESGGGGFVIFLLFIGLLGGGGYYLFKRKQRLEAEEEEVRDYDTRSDDEQENRSKIERLISDSDPKIDSLISSMSEEEEELEKIN